MKMCPCADRYAVYVSNEPCKGCGRSGEMCASCLPGHESACLKKYNDILRGQLRSLGVDPDKLLP